jgi:hypothetical protein
MPPRLYAPDEGGETHKERSASRPEPLPQLYRLTQHRDDDGPFVETLIVWDNEDGARCRHCPEGQCTFQAGPGAIGSCIVIKPGLLAAASPPLLTRNG